MTNEVLARLSWDQLPMGLAFAVFLACLVATIASSVVADGDAGTRPASVSEAGRVN
jgi:hypothetical protein